jgi:large subunit ribosomal protein L31
MAKKGLHPKWYSTKVFCDGKLVLVVGTTKEELYVDIWSGNHPFYTGSQKIIDTEGRVEKFYRKYSFNSFENLKEKSKEN